MKASTPFVHGVDIGETNSTLLEDVCALQSTVVHQCRRSPRMCEQVETCRADHPSGSHRTFREDINRFKFFCASTPPCTLTKPLMVALRGSYPTLHYSLPHHIPLGALTDGQGKEHPLVHLGRSSSRIQKGVGLSNSTDSPVVGCKTPDGEYGSKTWSVSV